MKKIKKTLSKLLPKYSFRFTMLGTSTGRFDPNKDAVNKSSMPKP